MSDIDWAALKAPFPIADLEWRVGSTNRDKTRGMVLCYLNARAVMDRLDTVIGPDNWRHSVRKEGNAWICRLMIRDKDDFTWELWHEDASDESDIEGIKGGASGAFKRAAVHLGIGRYLYKLPDEWAPLEGGKYLPRDFIPTLPAWALPGGEYNEQLISPAGAEVSPTGPSGPPSAPAPPPPAEPPAPVGNYGPPETENASWEEIAEMAGLPEPPTAAWGTGMKPPWWDIPIGFGKFKGKTMGHMTQGKHDGDRIGWLEWYVQQPVKPGQYEESNRKFQERCKTAISWKRSRD